MLVGPYDAAGVMLGWIKLKEDRQGRAQLSIVIPCSNRVTKHGLRGRGMAGRTEP